MLKRSRYVLVMMVGGTGAIACSRDTANRDETRATRADTSDVADRPTAVTVSEGRVGPLQIGMTLAAASAAIAARMDAPPAADTAACGFARWTGGPAGLRFMTARGRLVRIDVDSGAIATDLGVRIGDSEERVAALYGNRLSTTPQKYTAGHYLTVTVTASASADSALRIIFETDGKRVTRYRAGRMPEVGYVEGCG